MLSNTKFCKILPDTLSENIDYNKYSRCRLYSHLSSYYHVEYPSFNIDSKDIFCFTTNTKNSYITKIKKMLLNH